MGLDGYILTAFIFGIPVKYIMVRAEDGVELNGVDIQIDGN